MHLYPSTAKRRNYLLKMYAVCVFLHNRKFLVLKVKKDTDQIAQPIGQDKANFLDQNCNYFLTLPKRTESMSPFF